MKRILIGTVAMIMAMPCLAEDAPATGDKRITSKPYVDNAIATRQDKIPAANLSNTNYGETVMTYTPNGDGEIGERALFTGANEYDASTDADKLITASALNTAFTTLPETQTTKLVCANEAEGCTLWTITDQTAYGNAGGGSGGGGNTVDPATLAMLQALVGADGTGNCSKRLSNGSVETGNCTTAPSNYGDWGVMFNYNGSPLEVKGISACSSLSGTFAQPASNQSTVENDYVASGSGANANTNPPGVNCYCKMTSPAVSRWVFNPSASSSSGCAATCAYACGSNVRGLSGFRSGVFGSVQ